MGATTYVSQPWLCFKRTSTPSSVVYLCSQTQLLYTHSFGLASATPKVVFETVSLSRATPDSNVNRDWPGSIQTYVVVCDKLWASANTIFIFVSIARFPPHARSLPLYMFCLCAGRAGWPTRDALHNPRRAPPSLLLIHVVI